MTTDINIIAGVRTENKIKWFRSPYEYWILKFSKRINEFKSSGFNYPVIPENFRGGVIDLNSKNETAFLVSMNEFEVDKNILSYEFAKRYQIAKSYWDIVDLIPSIFLDFERLHFDSVYRGDVRLHNYVPSNWTSSYGAFFDKYSNDVFPKEDKFWIKGDSDPLNLIIRKS